METKKFYFKKYCMAFTTIRAHVELLIEKSSLVNLDLAV